MIDPVNGSGPVLEKDAKAPALPASKPENIKLAGNNSSKAPAPVKKGQ